MISKNLLNKNFEDFLSEAQYLGIAIESDSIHKPIDFVDLERFFLSGTYCLQSARIAEGFLCWLLRYGHLLSPSKIRRLIRFGFHYDQAVLGGFISLLKEHGINESQWSILKPFIQKSKKTRPLIQGPLPKDKNLHFSKYNILVHNYKLDNDKFLSPANHVYKHCCELKNRALFGSVVNADVASYLKWHPEATPYQISKATNSHKARVFDVYEDIKDVI